MKKLLFTLIGLLSFALPMWSAVDGKFTFSYPDIKDIPYNLGYQYSVYDLKESDIEGWRVMFLNDPVTLTYNITSEEDKTVEVVFDPTYLELVDVVIPDKAIDDATGVEYTVTAIGKMAFDDCPEIRSVIMGDSIRRIEDYAFNMCENKVLHKIGYVKFSKNLTHIGNYAFRNCHNLTTGHFTEGDQWPLTVADFVRNVDFPFYGYGGRQSGLENYLLLPESLEYIGKHAFEGCHFVNIKNEGVRREYGLSKVKIPNPGCVIDDYAFAGCKFLELVTIGEELTAKGLTNPNPSTSKKGRIGDYAFADCNLMRLDIPSSIERIGENAFSNCFHRIRMHTPRSNEGRIYFDNLKWFYPRSLFDNYDSWWANWNIGFTDKSREEKTNKYLDAWHTNTITIYGDNTLIGSNAFANNPLLEKVIIIGSAGEIADAMFKNCSNLKEVSLPDGLRKINSSMFMNCTSLESITIPDNVTEIGDSTFYGCTSLVTVKLPSALEKVSPYTFYKCRNLELSDLPEEVNSIGEYAFYGCEMLSSFTIPGKVTRIGDYAFADCYIHEGRRVNGGYRFFYGLTHVTVGDGVRTIGAHAFDGCRHLGKIEMGANVTEIGDYAFLNCMSCPKDGHEPDIYEASEVVLPGSLTSMGSGVFQGCSQLPAVTLGDNMTALPDYAFAYCSDLSSVVNISNITSANKNVFLGCYSLEDFGSVFDGEEDEACEDGIFYNHDKTEVVSALPNITYAEIPEGVVRINDGAFANCGALEYVTFPSTLEEIGSRAFENCVSLTYAELLNVKMGEFVYAGCTGIMGVDILEDFVQDINDNWFAGCVYMESIAVIGDNERYSDYNYELLLDKEGTTLLRAPSGISSLEIPETVTKIGDYACSNCVNLTYVEIPATVTHIGAHAFDNCATKSDNPYYEGYWGLSTVLFENLAVNIGDYAFNGCKNLQKVLWDGEALPDSMGTIGAYVFNDCESLSLLPGDFSSAVINKLEPYAFANFNGVRELILPADLETIGDHAFDGCSNLSSVEFPDGLKKIGKNAFQSTAITSLNLTDAIEEIGDSAFMNCTKVMDLKLPSSLKKINPYTFYKCFSGGEFDSKPEESFNLFVKIPDSVESIGDYAFYGCAVNTSKFHSEKTTYSDIFYYYMYGLLSVSIGENVKTIGSHAFDGCTNLVEVKLGDNVSSIGEYAFNDCFKQRFNGVREVERILYGTYEKPFNTFPIVWELEEFTPQPISLPDTFNSLGISAFSGCAELPSINFPSSLTDIPAMAFNGCEKISEIELPDGVTSIGDSAFGGCKGVKEISIPASLESGSRVFVDCDSAFSVTYHAEVPKAFDEAFFSPKVYSSHAAAVYAPNAPLDSLKGINPWALFYRIVAKDETLVHLERALETKNGLRFRILSNKPNPYCEVAGPAEPADGPTTYVVPDYVVNTDETGDYFGVPYKVIRIGNDAFENDLTLVGITIPEGVIDIGQEAFNGCKNLPEINLPSTVTNMGERAFANCYGLTYFEVPPLVTRLNNEVLRDCRGLYSIRMHDNIEELCAGALMDCRHLRKFERSENWKLKLIDDYALKNCIELEEINIPEGVVKIGKEAMYYCQKLNTVSLPLSLEQLGEKTFDDCEVLGTIKVYTETPPEMIGERHLTDQNCKIYVQAKTLDDYKSLWSVHEHRIEPGIILTIPTEKEMPEYIPGTAFRISSAMPLDGQTMTWSTSNKAVAAPDQAHDGTLNLNAVGRTHVRVDTDHKYYHDCDINVYPQRADANWDGGFDIADAVNIANYVVQNPGVLANWWETGRPDFDSLDEWEEFYNRGADVNRDSDISISDASAAVKIVLAQDYIADAPARKHATLATDGAGPDALLIFPPAGRQIGIGLDNSIEYVALQANIRVPQGMTLDDVRAGKRAGKHTLSTRRIDDRTMRIVLFDLDSNPFAPTDEPLLELTVGGKKIDVAGIEITDIVASDLASRSYQLTSRESGSHSGISSITSGDARVRAVEGGVQVDGAAGKTVTVCTVDGRTLRSAAAGSDSEFISLSAGVYIVTVDATAQKIAVK